MNLSKRIKVKFFFKDGYEVQDESFIPIFHRWIQEQKLDNHLLLDVADYSHVPNGLSVMLVAHEADYALDTENHDIGFSYTRKQDWPESADSLSKRLQLCLEENTKAAKFLAESNLPKIDFEAVEIRLVDKLATPETPEEQAIVKAAFETALKDVYGEAITVAVEAAPGDRRRAYGLRAKVSVSEAIAA